MKIFESGKLWPYAIALAITGVFFLGAWTIMETDKADIQLSNDYMTNYQNADADANNLIKSRIAFDKKYRLKYDTEQLKENGCDVKYKLINIDGKPVSDATMILVISRPEVATYTKTLKNSVFENGEYVFKDIKFPKIGRWNFMLKVKVGNDSRFYNVKTDTRIKNDRSVQVASEY